MNSKKADTKKDPILKPLIVTPEALEVVLESRALEDKPSQMALKIAVIGTTVTDYKYALELTDISEAEKTDLLYQQGEHDELHVIVPADSADALNGASLDIAKGTTGGLVIKNPNKPNPLQGAKMDLDLTGDLAANVKTVLDEAINPALASHGGFAELVGVEDTKVFVTMGGGCQGCAASAMTLKDGIRTMLIDSLPEITEVIDATDHAAGENPFYTE